MSTGSQVRLVDAASQKLRPDNGYRMYMDINVITTTSAGNVRVCDDSEDENEENEDNTETHFDLECSLDDGPLCLFGSL